MNGGGVVDDVDNSRNNPPSGLLDDDIVVFEILIRLPVKSLMRFKSVCKHWQFLIQHDPQFRDLHLTRSEKKPALYVRIRLHTICVYQIQEYLLSADLVEGRAVVHTIRKSKLLDYDDRLKSVNGLICFIHGECDAVSVYNPSTRQVLTPWTEPILNRDPQEVDLEGESDLPYYDYSREETLTWIQVPLDIKDILEDEWYPIYGFGFDPAAKEHKVICVWSRNKPKSPVVCEILTVGHNKWRRIDEVPLYEVKEKPVYVNGSIYWTTKAFHKHEEWDDGAPKVIVAFDVGSEKFRVVPFPDSILDGSSWNRSDLLEVEGRLALFSSLDSYTAKFWIFDDDCGNTNKENITTTSTHSINTWTELTITLPFSWDRSMQLNFYSVVGTDQIILKAHRCGVVFVYSYNWKKKTFKEVEISGISSATPGLGSAHLFTPIVESLFAV